jgi:hypothetical protein
MTINAGLGSNAAAAAGRSLFQRLVKRDRTVSNWRAHFGFDTQSG